VTHPRLRVLVVVAALLIGASSTNVAHQSQLSSDDLNWMPPGSGALPDALTEALAASPYAFFRFVNRAWASRVCAALADDVRSLPPVRLHGDAHIEQYAVTATDYGLDDFDDTAEGPPVIDIVRFLGSLRLTARERGWTGHFNQLSAAFLRGYRAGLMRPARGSDATLAPSSPGHGGRPRPVPRVVERLRQRKIPDQVEFLAWADALMKPVTPAVERATRRAFDLLASRMATSAQPRPPGYFKIKRFGRVYLGIGSRRLPKLLIRVEGPSSASNDDVILEAKEPANLAGIECLQPAQQSDAVRIVAGAEQIGRLKHDVLSLVPSLMERDGGGHHWWIHDWTPSYVEVSIDDLKSVTELSELAEDAGRQLGSASLSQSGTVGRQRRERESSAIGRLDARLRKVTIRLTDELLEGWQAFRHRSGRN
jgi:hypothetical protein